MRAEGSWWMMRLGEQAPRVPEALGELLLKGKSEPINVYAVLVD